MIKQRQLFNKGIIMAEYESQLNMLLDTIKEQDDFIEELEKKLKKSEVNEVKFACAYAKSIGVIKTKKEYKEYLKEKQKDPLDEIFVSKHKKQQEKNF